MTSVGMFSYTYSKLRGNYTGLTSSDISDGQAGWTQLTEQQPRL